MLIVLEGIDGSGKSSQYRRICEKLRRDGTDFKNITFPRYDKDSSALLRMYLNGEFGTHPDDVNAYTASLFFSVDRFASFSQDWGDDYRAGRLIFSDRYTTSNAVHQGSKVEDKNAFFSWLEDLEFNKIGLPRPDLVIYLDTDVETSLRRMRKRESENNSHADIHEADVSYLEKCLSTAREACDYFGWVKVPHLTDDGKERDIDEKNEEIYGIIKCALKNSFQQNSI